MNAEYCQTAQHTDQPPLSSLSGNSFYLICLLLAGLIDNVRHYFVRQSSFDSISRFSVNKLRDISLDNPQQQLKLISRNFEVEASLREMKLIRHQLP
jgi:hypothetical protein